jgi:hypothetical protein
MMATSAPNNEIAPGHYSDETKAKSSEELSNEESLPANTTSKQLDDGRYVLQDSDAWDILGYSFPTWRKWQILCVVFLIQISINLNASIFSHAVEGISEKFHVSSKWSITTLVI